MRYIVYDTETSGLSTTFDQIFQFAAVLADEELNEVVSFVLRRRMALLRHGLAAILETAAFC